jgi:hypothetical protein
MTILLAAVSVVCQVTYVAARQQAKTGRQDLLAAEAANVMEELMSRPWSEIDADEPPVVALSDSCRQEVPQAELRVTIEPDSEHPTLRRISVCIQEPLSPGLSGVPVQLVAWRCAP